MENFQHYASYLFHFIHIPLFLYDENMKCLDSYPHTLSNYHPTDACLQQLVRSTDAVSYVCVQEEVYWGMLRCGANQNRFLVLGPIAEIALSSRTIDNLSKDYLVLPEERTSFFEFFGSVPCLLLPAFINLLLFLDCVLNKTPSVSARELLSPLDADTTPISVSTEHQQDFYQHSESESLYNNHLIENELCSIIENGDLKKLKEFARTAHQTARYGTVAQDHIRQLKNTFIILATLASRSAIRGGLSPTFAYQISDSYIKQAENLWDADSIYNLMQTLQTDFCKRVADARKVMIHDNMIQRTIEYVHANMNKDINVETVAHAVGLSRSHLSRRFKQELGFSLSDFIRRCKLEEAKSLLLYTDKSISHISEYLYFSSQSYFQTVFKKQFGMTPLECRKQRQVTSFRQ